MDPFNFEDGTDLFTNFDFTGGTNLSTNFNFVDDTDLSTNFNFDDTAIWGDSSFTFQNPNNNLDDDFFSLEADANLWATLLEGEAPQEQEPEYGDSSLHSNEPHTLPAPQGFPATLGSPENTLHQPHTILIPMAPPTFSPYHFQRGGPLDTLEPMPSTSSGVTRPHRSDHRFDPIRVGPPSVPSQLGEPLNIPSNTKGKERERERPQKMFPRGRPSGSRTSAYVPPENFTSFAKRFVKAYSPKPSSGFDTHKLVTLYADAASKGIYTIAGWSQLMMSILEHEGMHGLAMFRELDPIFNYFEQWGTSMTDLYRMSIRCHVLSSVVGAILEELGHRRGTA